MIKYKSARNNILLEALENIDKCSHIACNEHDIATDEEQEKAKAALANFKNALKGTRPDVHYIKGYRGHLSYLFYMYKIDTAFREKDYCLAAHEIYTIFHYESCLQPRIYFNLIAILDEYL